MEKEHWNYVLNLKFEHSEHPEGISMYFKDLADAFRKLLLIPEHAFSTGSSEERYNSKIIIKAEISSVPELIPVLTVMYETDTSSGDRMIPGLYYQFSKAIGDFEQQCGIDLSGIKGYNKRLDNILVSHRVLEPHAAFKNSLGLDALKNDAREYDQRTPLFSMSLVNMFFKTSGLYTRSVNPEPYIQEFFFDNADEAIKALLQIDYNKLNEYVAWENDLEYYYSKAEVKVNGWSIAELLSLRQGQISVGFTTISVPGIHLRITARASAYGITLPLEIINGSAKSSKIFQVGTYNRPASVTAKVTELKTILEWEVKNNRPKPEGNSRQLPIKKAVTNKAKHKGRGI